MLTTIAFLALAQSSPNVHRVAVIDMIRPRLEPRILVLRSPLVSPADWPRKGDEMSAGGQPHGEFDLCLWLGRAKTFGTERLAGLEWSPSGQYLMTHWAKPKQYVDGLRVFNRKGKLLASRHGIDGAVYWSYRGSVLIMHNLQGKRTVWSPGKVPAAIAQGRDRMDEVYDRLVRTGIQLKLFSENLKTQSALSDARFNSVVGAATYSRGIVHQEDDHRLTYFGTVLWCGPDSSWKRAEGDDEGGFHPVAGGWAHGTGRRGGRPVYLLWKGSQEIALPCNPDDNELPRIYVH